MNETVYLNLFPLNASKSLLYINNLPLKSVSSCKYLAVHVDFKLSFNVHIDFVRNKIRNQGGIISEMRHYVPKSFLLQHYRSNTKQILQTEFSYMVAPVIFTYCLF